jgi:hypothetical protein
VFTKDNLVRRNWIGNKLCVLCVQGDDSTPIF